MTRTKPHVQKEKNNPLRTIQAMIFGETKRVHI